MISCTSETCTRAEQGKPAGTQTKNAPQQCEAFGAENETRTRDPDLGKVVLYQLSYFRNMSMRAVRSEREYKDTAKFGKSKLFFVFFEFVGPDGSNGNEGLAFSRSSL